MEQLSVGNAVSGSGWEPVDLDFRLTPAVLAEILDGGQAFAWDATGTTTYSGAVADHAWEIGLAADGTVLANSPTGGDPALLADYFALDTDFAALTDALPWRSDTVLARAIRQWPGLRILRQDPGEALLGFLCSSTKQIVQIKEILRLFARHYGMRLHGEAYALPSWDVLSTIPEDELRRHKTGYRARYIAAVAKRLADDPGLPDRVRTAPYPEARAMLTDLPGVGGKIADCVLLFAGGHLGAFPVDTWIANVLRTEYGLADWSPLQLRRFGEIHFGPHAGLAQQYLFSAVRRKRATAAVDSAEMP
ncbi:MAG: DNA-binding protein [Opitutales bacterium]|nr:DNA-binding protein [Opitutales bacterium]